MNKILRGIKACALYFLIAIFMASSILPAPALANLQLLPDTDKPLKGQIDLTCETADGDGQNPLGQIGLNCEVSKKTIQYTDQPWNGTIDKTIADSTPDYFEAPEPLEGAPNILTIVIDDAGFAGFGSYGGRIATPHIDHLAYNGLRYNNFHVFPVCSPTRAALLTGRNPHTVGMAGIPEVSNGYPNKSGSIPSSAAMLPAVLKPYGYTTFALGKWHMTPTWAMTPATGHFDQWPTGKGFDHFYGFLGGETNQYYPELYRDTTRVQAPGFPEEGYHLSEDLVDNAINYIKDLDSTDPDRPYFMYLSFGAVHAPHHTPEFYRDMYKYHFDEGYDVERETILAEQQDLGIVPEGTVLSPRNAENPEWDSLEPDQKELFSTFMENYAGFMTHVDAQIGRLMDYLDSMGQLDDTLIMVISDNGASAEGSENGTLNEMTYFNGITPDLEYNIAHEDDIGTTRSEPHIPWGWSLAYDTPFQWAKRFTHEGGIHTPFIVHWPAKIQNKGAIRTQWQYVTDIVPTVLDLLNIEMPETVNEALQQPLHGNSFLESFNHSDAPSTHTVQYWENKGNRAVYQDGWKAVTEHTQLIGTVEPDKKGDFDADTWELYYLPDDFSEANDLASENPEKLQDMQNLFDEQAQLYNVYPLDDRESYELIAAKNEALGEGASEFTFYQGMSPLHQDLAPNTFDNSYTIDVYLDRDNADSEGVLVAQGGTGGGYTLYIKDNKLMYEYNYLGFDRYTIDTNATVPVGKSQITYKFSKFTQVVLDHIQEHMTLDQFLSMIPDINTGELLGENGDVDPDLVKMMLKRVGAGLGQVFIDNKLVAEQIIPKTVPTSFGIEFFDVGQDSQSPVSLTYKPPFTFNDFIDKVTVKIGLTDE